MTSDYISYWNNYYSLIFCFSKEFYKLFTLFYWRKRRRINTLFFSDWACDSLANICKFNHRLPSPTDSGSDTLSLSSELAFRFRSLIFNPKILMIVFLSESGNLHWTNSKKKNKTTNYNNMSYYLRTILKTYHIWHPLFLRLICCHFLIFVGCPLSPQILLECRLGSNMRGMPWPKARILFCFSTPFFLLL